MTKKRILIPGDRKNFDHLQFFPGIEGNPFDQLLRLLNKINQIPLIYFLIQQILLSGVLTFFNFQKWFFLLVFSIADILILNYLPKFKISFGDFKSQVFLLLLLRAVFIWIPYPFSLVFQFLGVLLIIYGFYIEPSQINLTRLDLIESPQSPVVKFLHIADIHMERIGKREEKLLALVNKYQPDFILFSGDFLNLSNIRDIESIQQVSYLFNQINDISPIYYVTGSPAVDIDETVLQIEELSNAKRLDNSNHTITINGISINLIGITCTHQPHLDIKNLNSLEKQGMRNILLYHSPDLVYELPPDNKVDLMLSGHTHGGQVRIPLIGALFTGSLYGRKLQAGLYQFYDTLLYISRGIGLEGLGAPKVRFLSRPEIIEWKIN